MTQRRQTSIDCPLPLGLRPDVFVITDLYREGEAVFVTSETHFGIEVWRRQNADELQC